MSVCIGTSGWQYPHWRGSFYPAGLPVADQLEWYATRFRTVEVNATFYGLPRPGTLAGWAARTPDDFVFALKASRYLTHVRRLRQPREPVGLFLSRARELGGKLGPILLQLPPTLRRDPRRLERTLACFPPGVRIAVEPRHTSWFDEEVRALLAAHDAALCLADRGSRWISPPWRTASWTYVRFHEGAASPPPSYGRAALHSRARTLARVFGARRAIYAYFNNDRGACAPRDARRFAAAVEHAGLESTRVPGARETRLA